MRQIGITTTVPIEIIYASGAVPIDLNNLFITYSDPQTLVNIAENKGFPRTTCTWIKGLYSIAMLKGIKEIITVLEGDCSNTHALSEIWQQEGITTIPFSFPYNKDLIFFKHNFNFLQDYFKVTTKDIYNTKGELDKIRDKLQIIDTMTYRENIVSGFENHLFLVSSSDFLSDPNLFEGKIDNLLYDLKHREPFRERVRLGLIGVPPIILNIYQEIERLGARVVFNEIQLQFAMLNNCQDIYEQYLQYTYPYSVFGRIENIKKEIAIRNLDGIIHYTQSFCFRNIQDQIFKKMINIPILTLEGDKPEPLDQRNKIRLESFIDMLMIKKERR